VQLDFNTLVSPTPLQGDAGRCFILGSSPSLADEQLHLLEGERVFLCNGAWRALRDLDLAKANYIIWTGQGSWKNDIPELLEYRPNAKVFYSDLVSNCKTFKQFQTTTPDHHCIFRKSGLTDNGKMDLLGGYFPRQFKDGWGSARSVVIDAMIIAVLMGYKEICILGMDLDYTGRSYFYDEHDWLAKVNSPTGREKTFKTFAQVTKTLHEKGVAVKQLSKGFNRENYNATDAVGYIQYDTLERIVEGIWKPKTIGMYMDSFDNLTPQHIDFINKTRHLCDKLVLVAPNEDSATVCKALRKVSNSIASKDFEDAVQKLYRRYPKDKIRIFHNKKYPLKYDPDAAGWWNNERTKIILIG